jgi:hypothetical protein
VLRTDFYVAREVEENVLGLQVAVHYGAQVDVASVFVLLYQYQYSK